MKSFPIPKQKGWNVFSLFVLGLALCGILCKLDNPYLWFDEANQFFISLGLPRDSPPLAPWGGFADIVRENNRYLFDPLGYTLLLRLWQEASTSAAWLRSLSLVGAVGALLTGYRLLRTLKVAKTEALLLATLLISFSLLFHFSTEVRGYSYEAWGTLYALLVACRYRSDRSARWLFGQGLALSFFLWIRYPVVVPIALATGMMALRRQQTPVPGSRKRFGLLLLPLGVNAMLIYWFCIRRQPIDPGGMRYAHDAILYYGSSFLLRPGTMILHGYVGLFFATFLFPKAFQGTYQHPARQLGIFTAVLFVVWNVLSLLGKIPSDPAARWAIELNVTAVICLCLVVAMALRKLPTRLLPAAYLLLGAVALCRPALATYRWATNQPGHFTNPAMIAKRSQVAKATTPIPLWTADGMFLEMKYLYEFGVLKTEQQADGYPQRFVVFDSQAAIDSLRRLPLHHKIIWAGQPKRFVQDGRFEAVPIPGTLFYNWVWRVR